METYEIKMVITTTANKEEIDNIINMGLAEIDELYPSYHLQFGGVVIKKKGK